MEHVGMETETGAVEPTVEHDVKQGPYASCDTVADVLRKFEAQHDNAPESLRRVADAMEKNGCDHTVDQMAQVRLVQHLKEQHSNEMVGPKMSSLPNEPTDQWLSKQTR
jgi:hypothetical protein